MNARALEEKINKRFGTKGNFSIDEGFKLIRTIEDDAIVILDFSKPEDGRHLLRDASAAELEKIANYFDGFDDDTNLLVPGTPGTVEEERKKNQDAIEDDMIPGFDEKPDEGNNDMIPD